MFTGRIDEVGFWHLKGRLYYNRKVYPNEIDFLVDSGSQLTILSPTDAKELGIGFDTLKGSREIDIGGSGGKCIGRNLLNAGIILHWQEDDKNVLEQCHKMYVPDPKKYPASYSMIGHEILNRYNVISNNRTHEIKLKLANDKYVTIP